VARVLRGQTLYSTASQLLAPMYTATAVGVYLRTIEYYKKRPDVKARIREIADKAAALIETNYDGLQGGPESNWFVVDNRARRDDATFGYSLRAVRDGGCPTLGW
jgi:hypothetical protein